MVLGDNRTKTAMHIRHEAGADYCGQYCTKPITILSSCRACLFLTQCKRLKPLRLTEQSFCRNGTLQHPEAIMLRQTGYSGKIGLALDPCAALQACPLIWQLRENVN